MAELVLEDFFQTIVGVHWRKGGVGRFIATDALGYVYSSVDGFNWSKYFTGLSAGENGFNYQNGAWASIGQYYLDESDGDWGGMISTDGFSWSKIWDTGFPPSENFIGLTYDATTHQWDYRTEKTGIPLIHNYRDNPNPYNKDGSPKYGGVAQTFSPVEGGTYGPPPNYAVWITGGKVENGDTVFVGRGYDDASDRTTLVATKDGGLTWRTVVTADYAGWVLGQILFEEPSTFGIGAGGGSSAPKFAGHANGGYISNLFATDFHVDVQYSWPPGRGHTIGGNTFYGNLTFTVYCYSNSHDSSYMNNAKTLCLNNMQDSYDWLNAPFSVRRFGSWWRNSSGTPAGGNWDGPDGNWSWNYLPPSEYYDKCVQAVKDAVAEYPGGWTEWNPGIQHYWWWAKSLA